MDSVTKVMARIDRLVDEMIADKTLDSENKDTAKLVLAVMQFGCKSIDKLAAITELPRDRFVRPRARRMRAAGLWNRNGTYTTEYPDGPDELVTMEFILHVMCAEGLVNCVKGTKAD